jgi:hypothetical protein
LSVPIALPPCLSASNACLKQVNSIEKNMLQRK